jgi:enoyl-[acyl-carrier protein] reductase II
MGTRFVASHEARAAQDYKKRIAEIREEDTVVTRCYSGKPMRVIRNRYVEEYETRPEEIQPFPTQLGVSIKAGVFSAVFPDSGEVDVSRSAMPCGQGAGAITDELSCASIVDQVMREAAETIERLGGLRG